MSDASQEHVDAIIRILIERVNPTLTPKDLSAETGLVGDGLGLDSMAILELVTGLEDDLGIMIDESELKIEVIDRIGSLARFLGEQDSES